MPVVVGTHEQKAQNSRAAQFFAHAPLEWIMHSAHEQTGFAHEQEFLLTNNAIWPN